MTRAAATLPLGFSPLSRAVSVESTEEFISQALLGSRILSIQDKQSFGIAMNGTRLGSVELSCAGYDSGFKIQCDTAQDCVIVSFAEGNPTSTLVNKRPVDVINDICVIDHDARSTHIRTGGASEHILKVPMSEVEQRLQMALDRRLSSPLRFDHAVSGASDSGRAAKTLLKQITQWLDANPAILEMPLLRSNFEELLYGLILNLPNNYTRELQSRDGSRSAPASVRQAEEFIEAHADMPITISDILPHAGCSKKVLFDNFRKFRGYTPTEFLIDVRLRMAHNRLTDATPPDTVTSIAFNCGFSHMGRFAKTYQSRYGVAPSVTLRCSRNLS